jgi:hypothetical protein
VGGGPSVEVTGKNPKLEIALELERIALEDEYFVKRKLYPNLDFYSGIIYQAMGFKPDMFTVLVAIPRTVGWLAQWQEMLEDPEQKIARPRQIYTGYPARNVIPVGKRAMQALAGAGRSWPTPHECERCECKALSVRFGLSDHRAFVTVETGMARRAEVNPYVLSMPREYLTHYELTTRKALTPAAGESRTGIN